jgi:hypothetical protein
MSEIKTVRWKRYGKDRLYVKDEAGTELGWVDLLTGQRNVTDASRQPEFDEAVNNWYVEMAAPAAPATMVDLPPPPRPPLDEPQPVAPEPVEVPPSWHDLATHVPGQAARAQALRKRDAMRERSRPLAFIARAFDVKTEERAWRIGADGEETVGARLEKLTKHGWHVLHAVPVGTRGRDIDHVVIGWGGVYTLNAKNRPGARVWVGEHAVRVDGQPTQYLRKSQDEAEHAGRILSQAVGFAVPVRSALVFLTGTLIPNVTIKKAPADVAIYDRMDIPGVFKRAPRRIDTEQVEAIYEAARRCTTWSGSPHCTCA